MNAKNGRSRTSFIPPVDSEFGRDFFRFQGALFFWFSTNFLKISLFECQKWKKSHFIHTTDNLIDDEVLFNGTDKNCIPLPDNFIWSEEAKHRYQETFHTQEMKSKISDIEKEVELQDVHIQSLIDKLTDVMLLAGNKTLLRKSFKLKRKHIYRVNKKWYDKDCRSVLREVKSTKNAFNRNVFNSTLRMQYYSKFKDYKRLVKYKKEKIQGRSYKYA